MVQQTDPKFSEYVLANSETSYPKQDKKTGLKDLQNENTDMVVSKSDGSSLLKENVTVVEDVKIAGMKRQQQTPASNNGHLVYVRRKTESEQHKSSTCNKPYDQPTKQLEHDGNNHGQYPMNDSTIGIQKANDQPTKVHEHGENNHEHYPMNDSTIGIQRANDQPTKVHEHGENNHEHYPMNDSTIGIQKANDQPTKVHEHGENNPEHYPMNDSTIGIHKTNDQPTKVHEQYPMNDPTIGIQKDVLESKSSEGVSSTTPVPTLDSEKSNVNSLSIQHWEERYLRLQKFLKALDLSNQDDYLSMLRSLSSVGLSRVAVELERRSIQLSMEEAREVQRAKLVDLLDVFPTSTEEPHQTMK